MSNFRSDDLEKLKKRLKAWAEFLLKQDEPRAAKTCLEFAAAIEDLLERTVGDELLREAQTK